MNDLISRAEAIYEIHDFFSELMDKLPITVDEDGDEVITDAKTANTLLVYNKMLCKRFDALPSADRPRDGDLISREEAIETIEIVDWYHQNQNKDMVHGANDDEHQAWYKADDVYKALEAVPSAEAVPQSEQYKKGFEDAKRAFLVEYARESQNMRKRIAQLEARLNAQKAISADRPRGEWIPVSEKLPDDGKWAIWCSNDGVIGIARFKEDCYNHFYPNGTSFGLEDAVAWMPLPEPYKGGDDK